MVAAEAIRQARVDLQTAAERLPSEYCERHPDVAWDELRAMRNYFAHDYSDTDYLSVWNALSRRDTAPTAPRPRNRGGSYSVPSITSTKPRAAGARRRSRVTRGTSRTWAKAT